jgi:hypothetical protein
LLQAFEKGHEQDGRIFWRSRVRHHPWYIQRLIHRRSVRNQRCLQLPWCELRPKQS